MSQKKVFPHHQGQKSQSLHLKVPSILNAGLGYGVLCPCHLHVACTHSLKCGGKKICSDTF